MEVFSRICMAAATTLVLISIVFQPHFARSCYHSARAVTAALTLFYFPYSIET